MQVARSKALLNSLGEEQDRWKSGSDVFKSQMSTIVGDVLLTSAFMAYAGYFDQGLRRSLYSSWSQHLQDASVAYRSDLAIFEVHTYICSPTGVRTLALVYLAYLPQCTYARMYFPLVLQYLSTADERLAWRSNALPADDLCVENAIMMKRFNRYPLIIDPSGQATEFLLNEYKDKKILKTR